MTTQLSSGFENELNLTVKVSAVLSAVIHAFLWCCVLFGMVFVVPQYSKVFEDFGIELSSLLVLLIDVSHLSSRLWPLGVLAILVAAVADWWVLEQMAKQPKKSLKSLWFWGNVAAPILAAIVITAVIATTIAQVTNALS